MSAGSIWRPISDLHSFTKHDLHCIEAVSESTVNHSFIKCIPLKPLLISIK